MSLPARAESLTPAAPEVDLAAWSDRKLDITIVRSHGVAGAHMNGYEEAAAVTGHLLKERQRRLGPRKFKPWLEAHFNGDRTTAWRYMKMADEVALRRERAAESELYPGGGWRG